MNAADLSRILVTLEMSRSNLVKQHNLSNVGLVEEIDDVLGIIRTELENTPVKVTRGLRRRNNEKF